MNITPEDMIIGLPARTVRDVLRKCHSAVFVDNFAQHMGVTESEASTIILGLVAAGYLAKSDHYPQGWEPTTAGNALRMASVRKPYKRASADRAYAAFMDRVRVVAESPAYIYRVKRVVLFGSYLDEQNSHVNDIDLAVTLDPKESDPAKHKEIERSHVANAISLGKTFSDYFQQLVWPREEIYRFLKSRSPMISLIDPDDDVLKEAAQRVVFEV